jgi:selenide,water dikinase
MAADVPPVADIVLLGGGHSHVQVLKSFGMNPLPGVRLTIISREADTPYSGMLPGYVAGHYEWSDIHIDLGPLTRFANARLIVDETLSLDTETQVIHLRNHPPVHYDYLSINTGAVPEATGSYGVAVKPIGQFLPQWHADLAGLESGDQIVLVGGGAGGAELAMAMRHVLPPTVSLVLLCRGLLTDLPQRARELCETALADRQIEVISGDEPLRLEDDQLHTASGRMLEADRVYWVTGVIAPQWPAQAGLAVDELGFIKVDQHLRSSSHPNVFAAGDVAHLIDQTRPKSGVFAVRAGGVLSDNLRRAALGRSLRRFRAQKSFLKLISLGEREAVGVRGTLAVKGSWVWHWKDWIDRRFMRRFNDLPAMDNVATLQHRASALQPFANTADLIDPMRCGGCGAKLGADPLRRVLARLPAQDYAQVHTGIGDDAAAVRHTDSTVLLTTDGFRALLDDPYLFGRITAHHSLNDIFAMGAKPVSALALATVPLMSEQMMEEDLYHLLKGAVDVLNDADVALVGGHTAEGTELSLGLTITGTPVEPLMTKDQLHIGDRLIVTKALGVGAMMSAYMRGKLPSAVLQPVLASMDQSNRKAMEIARSFGVRAATDITGFGLLGHLGEMLRASGTGSSLNVSQLPVFDGAMACMTDNLVSVLQRNNEGVLTDFELRGITYTSPRLRLAVDPQTSGGLLLAVAPDAASACVEELVEAGYTCSVDVGEVTESNWILAGSAR